MHYQLGQVVKYPSRKKIVEAKVIGIQSITEIREAGTFHRFSYNLILLDDFGTIVGEATQFTLDRHNQQVIAA